MPCGVEPHGLGNRTPAQVLWSGTVPDGIAPLRLSHTDIRPDTSEQCSFQRGYGDASEARTRTLQRERLMTLPIRLWHRRKEIWLGKRLLLSCRHGWVPAPVDFHHYILLSPSLLDAEDGNFRNGGPCWTRTSDTLINSQVLYRLSYRGVMDSEES